MGYLETVLTILQATPQWKEAMQSMTQEEMRVNSLLFTFRSFQKFFLFFWYLQIRFFSFEEIVLVSDSNLRLTWYISP